MALIAYVVLAVGYLTLTPPWQNPDEPAHFNYVAFVATTGGLPVLQQGDWDSALLERLKTGTLQQGDDITKIRYESWQPPLFYLLAAPIYRITSQQTEALARLRTLNVVFGAITLVLAYRVAREALPDPLPGAAPLTIVGIPMFTAVSAAVSADPLANLLAAAILLTLVIRLRQPKDAAIGWPILTGALLGLGLLTKLELAIFAPLVLAVILLRSTRKLRETLLASVSAAILLIPWLVHQVTSYGWTDPLAIARHSAVVQDQPRFTGFSLDWLTQFATTSFHSFWAQFGWMAIVAPPRLYLIWGAITVLAVIGLAASRQWLRQPAALMLVGTLALAAIAYVGYNLAFVQFQARYLFTALVPIAILLVRGWSALPPRPWLAFVLPAALIGLNAYALLRVLVPGFAPGV